LKYQ